MNLAKLSLHYADTLEHQLQRVKYSLRRNGFSHAGEERILNKHIANLLPPTHCRTAVDIGAANGIRWSNTYSLFLRGWKGVGIEADARKFPHLERAYRNLPNVTACHQVAEPHNIISLLRAFDIEENFSVLSLDIDGNDYWLLKTILSEFRPHLIVTEINEKIPPPLRFVVKYKPNAAQLRHHFYGYSIALLEDLCEEFDYGVLELEYENAFIAPHELRNARFVTAEEAYVTGYLNRVDRKERFPANFDMEVLQSLSVAEGIEFLRNFYAKQEGEYFLTSNRESLIREMLGSSPK